MCNEFEMSSKGQSNRLRNLFQKAVEPSHRNNSTQSWVYIYIYIYVYNKV